MELDAAQAARLHALQLVFPVHIGRMQGAEADDLFMLPLQLHGIIVGRDDLCGGRGRAQDDASVDAGGLLTLQEVLDGSVTAAVQVIDRIEMVYGLVGDLGMEGVGMDVKKHDGLGCLVGDALLYRSYCFLLGKIPPDRRSLLFRDGRAGAGQGRCPPSRCSLVAA